MSRTPSIPFTAIVLAAGQGTRMNSQLAKILHTVAGKSLVQWAVDNALSSGAKDVVVVVGHAREQVEALLKRNYGSNVRTVVQAEQRGTGHAVQCAIDAVAQDAERVVILYGDCPTIPKSVVGDLVNAMHSGDGKAALVASTLDDPTGYGRIVCDEEGRVAKIVEQRDCNEHERALKEVNPGIYCFDATFLRHAISELNANNAQGELYLTDLIETAAADGDVQEVAAPMTDLAGVNDQLDLARASARAHQTIANTLAKSGVGMRDTSRVYVDATCTVHPGAFLDNDVHLRGTTEVHQGAHIDVGCVLLNVEVGQSARLLPYTVATDSQIGEQAQVGPFSHLRPSTKLGKKSKVGNFSETKNTTVGDGSKVNHLSYVGDGEIGERVNIGAGTIFCNYDGAQKHTTTLEDDVFIGSDTQLIAPVTIGKGAYVASGTTITRDVPADALAVSRTKQENKEGYASRLRARQKPKKK